MASNLARSGIRVYSIAMDSTPGKVVVMHGLTQDEAVLAMRAVKAALELKDEIAFAMSTETNLGWKLQDLVEHVLEEHEQMTGRHGS